MAGDGVVGVPAEAFAADPDVGRDLAAVDWEATPLGKAAEWPQSLRTAVDILLSSRFSMWMAWGPELTFFCNAAYRRDTLGQKYPWALGRPAEQVWREIWPEIGPRIRGVLSTGEATWDRELLLFLERSGYTEESYHTFSYSPLRDDAGAVVGMLCVVTEETDRVIGERRMVTLRDLGSDPSAARTDRELLRFAAGRFERNRSDLPFTVSYLFGEDGAAHLAAASGITPGHRLAPLVLPAAAPGVWPDGPSIGGESLLVDLADDAHAPAGDWPDPPLRAAVVPLHRPGGSPIGFLAAGLNRYRPFDDAYRGFVELAAGHLAAGVESARGYQMQERRAEELAALDRAKTTFFSNISHEFRTPLALITGPVQELRDRLADIDPDLREQADIVYRNGLRLGKLVNALLDFSRIEADRMQARYEPVDLAAVTAELAGVFRSAIEKAGLEFAVDAPALARTVYVDRGMWEKVVLNLLSNALKFTFEGRVLVRVRPEGDHAVVSVSDTGVGVAEAEMPRLFERFHRVENALARSTEGSGIGLALVKELVELHGGTIGATSREGEGTTFTVTLPFGRTHLPSAAVADDAKPTASDAPRGAEAYVQEALRWLPEASPEASTAVLSETLPAQEAREERGPLGSLEVPPEAAWTASPADEAASSETSDGGQSGPIRLVVADDNADMRQYLTRLLRAAGHEVTSVADGEQALRAIRAEVPDLVVSDVMMPRIDGLALVAALRADPRTATVPVLLLSARAGEDAAIEGLAAGADDYLVKPFPAAELLARVRAGVEMARLRTHHARWRTAVVDSLQEGFFVCDADGTVVEVNATFADILGYGPEDLPYRPPQPWRSDPQEDGPGRTEYARFLEQPSGEAESLLVRRDGRRVWARVTYNRVVDPASGLYKIVGTVRDVTAEHRAARRAGALAGLADQLARAQTGADALRGAAGELARIFGAARVVLAAFGHSRTGPAFEPDLVAGSDDTAWAALPPPVRERVRALSRGGETPGRSEPDGRHLAVAAGYQGGVLVVWVEPSVPDPAVEEDLGLLARLAARLAEGMARVSQIDVQRETALALQHAILGPDVLPPGFAGRYQPAASPLQVGGDWYDTVPLPDGRIGIVVGDCVGHGLAAATVMGQLRSACRSLLLEYADPVRVLAGLDRFAALLPGAACTTVFAAVLDPATGALDYSAAGHPPPVLAFADGATATLEDGRGLPVGVRPDRPRARGRAFVPARSSLLLYTDGLVERRRQSIDTGIDRAAAVLHEHRTQSVEDLARIVTAALTPRGGYEDDVALLLYRHPGPLDIEFNGTDELTPVRDRLRAWLGQCGLAPQQVLDVLIAAGEACANALEHGHRDLGAAPIRLVATALPDRLHLRVTDSGSWKPSDPKPPGPSLRGRGIALMRAVMQQVTITPGPEGTTVEMHARIPA